MNSSVNRFLGAALVLLVLALAAFLRFYHLNSYSLWSDEFVTLMIVSARSSRELIHACFEIPQPMPPLYFLLTRLPVLWLGPSEISLRLLSAGSSLLIVYLVYKLGRLLFSTEIGLFGALLCAVDTTQIVYAQNARPYALCLMLSCVSYFMFLRWLQTRQRRFQIGYVLSTTLLFYGHYIFFPMVLSQNLFFWWQQRTHHLNSSRNGASLSWKAWLMLQGVVGLLLLPLIPQLAAILRTRFSLNWYKVYPKYSDLFVFFNGKLLFFAAAATLSIAGISLLLKGLWRRQERNRLIVEQPQTDSAHAAKFRRDSLILLLLWYLVPVLVFFFFARSLGLNLFVERYLVLSTIPTFLIIAVIPFSLPQQWLTRLFLVVYFLHYAYMEPVAYYQEKGEFSQGVPGANEWRETLTELSSFPKRCNNPPVALNIPPYLPMSSPMTNTFGSRSISCPIAADTACAMVSLRAVVMFFLLFAHHRAALHANTCSRASRDSGYGLLRAKS